MNVETEAKKLWDALGQDHRPVDQYEAKSLAKITQALWDAKAEGRKEAEANAPHPFCGLHECGVCGTALDAAKAKGLKEGLAIFADYKAIEADNISKAHECGWQDAIAASKCHDPATCPDCAALVEKGREEMRVDVIASIQEHFPTPRKMDPDVLEVVPNQNAKTFYNAAIAEVLGSFPKHTPKAERIENAHKLDPAKFIAAVKKSICEDCNVADALFVPIGRVTAAIAAVLGSFPKHTPKADEGLARKIHVEIAGTGLWNGSVRQLDAAIDEVLRKEQ